MDKIIVGKKLKYLRNSKDLSMEQLKDFFNGKYNSKVSKSMISNRENGRYLISNKNLNLYVDFFDVPLSYFLNDNIPVVTNNYNVFDKSKIEKAILKALDTKTLSEFNETLQGKVYKNLYKDNKDLIIADINKHLNLLNFLGLMKMLNYAKDLSTHEDYKSKYKNNKD